MCTTSEVAVRELDRRTSDGIDVRLLWNSQTGRVSVAVEDERGGESFRFTVDGAYALAAFHHPYAYAIATTPVRCSLRERRPPAGSTG